MAVVSFIFKVGFHISLSYFFNHKLNFIKENVINYVYITSVSVKLHFIYLIVGMNAQPIHYTTSGIYRSGTSSTVETSPDGSRYLCYKYFTENDAKVVCLIWGLLP